MTNRSESWEQTKGRQDGDYEAPILSEPVGGPIPDYEPDDDDQDDDEAE